MADAYDIYGSTNRIAREVALGRQRAHDKHGANSIEGIDARSPKWLAILVEEVGEASHELTYDATGSLRAELIDVITVATAWVAALDSDYETRIDGHKVCATCGDEVAYCGESHPKPHDSEIAHPVDGATRVDDDGTLLVCCATCNQWIEHFGDPAKTLFEHMGESHD